MSTIENLQNNLRFELCTNPDTASGWDEKNGKARYTIEDKTQPLKSAHVFYEGFVDVNDDVQVMVSQMYEGYCTWLSFNRERITEYFKNKKSN